MSDNLLLCTLNDDDDDRRNIYVLYGCPSPLFCFESNLVRNKLIDIRGAYDKFPDFFI